jgi:hypothetical protein
MLKLAELKVRQLEKMYSNIVKLHRHQVPGVQEVCCLSIGMRVMAHQALDWTASSCQGAQMAIVTQDAQ